MLYFDKVGDQKMDLGERIRYVRKFRKMTQLELAEKCGLGNDDNARTRISQYENGSRTPKAETLEKICEALNISSYYITTKEHMAIYDFVYMLFDFDCNDFFNIKKENDRYYIDLDYNTILDGFMEEWMQKKEDLRNKNITMDEYIEWKINYGSHK